MDKSIIFKDVLEAEHRDDRAAVTSLSVALAYSRIASTGARRYGITMMPRNPDALPTLGHALTAMGFGFIHLDLSWLPAAGCSEIMERVFLLPGLDAAQARALERHAEMVLVVDLGDDSALLGHLRGLRQGHTLVGVRYTPQASVEALAEMTASHIRSRCTVEADRPARRRNEPRYIEDIHPE